MAKIAAEKAAKEQAERDAIAKAAREKKEKAEREIRIQMENEAAAKARVKAEMSKITDGMAVVAHNEKNLQSIKTMRSKQLDEGVTDPQYKDELEQAVLDAETERYTAAQKGHIHNFVQKNNGSHPANSTKTQKKVEQVKKVEHPKKVNASEDILERQAK